MKTWNDIFLKHKTQSAVYVVDGLPFSILCSAELNNINNLNSFIYIVPNKSLYKKMNDALILAHKSSYEIRVYKKIVKNSWLDDGLYRIKNYETKDLKIQYEFLRL